MGVGTFGTVVRGNRDGTEVVAVDVVMTEVVAIVVVVAAVMAV